MERKIHSNIRLIEREKLTHTLTFNVIVNSTYLYNVHLTIKHNKKKLYAKILTDKLLQTMSIASETSDLTHNLIYFLSIYMYRMKK